MDQEIKELIIKAQSGNQEYFNKLFKRYEYYIQKVCSSFYYRDSKGDIIQESSIAFIKAVKAYQIDSKVDFSVYLRTIIRNHLINYIKKNSKNIEIELQENYMIGNVNNDFYTKDNKNRITKKLILIIKTSFSDKELKVFRYYISNYSYKQMSDIMGVSIKAVDNAIYRVKHKLGQSFSKEEVSFILSESSIMLEIRNFLIQYI